jgi:hypothetical protein
LPEEERSLPVFEGEDVEVLGLSKRARILVTYEMPIAL